ncbi:restriction endonuclease [Candidatus Roizmanbacteria bacterium CG_4_9_14_0_2_um_filter_39_13]|uniref:Restriction endonuclease n=1 Tax=Candidatus Roizmanbacteria bacterium CG_4_9_14_0_2_um_filter_39_13 TaxID=1974839 RepID=A0A2M8EZ82_9BACT|nr:MAG: restriction endonuclease [Candidatus Roizmanbacteria bacterium CG_4_10_14_0_2_um_filter_39_12]PJC32206.1 MAG: restriction endonuclease [Candidatus Roizmanbacteria bacterium CG_4_9_14_0_2_um_filter_39_13]
MSKYQKLSKEELLKLVEKQDTELESKKYGLLWDREKEPEQVVLDCENNLPILKRITEKEIRTDESDDNIFIEGDNYHSLTVLNYTHKGKIDVIYIDPPYNTGKKDEWKYNDKFIDDNDSYRHAKWLNMMEKRLELSKHLLKEDGVIFISIGEQEVANLNLLCGKVFRHENFLTLISRISKTASDKGNIFAPSCDYIVCYAKNKANIDTSNFYDEVDEDLYTKEDKDGRYRDDVALYQSGLIGLRPNCRYFIKAPDGSKVIPPEGKFWRWEPKTSEKNKALLVFKETKNSPLLDQNGKKAKYNIYTKSYLEERRDKGTKPRNFLVDKKFLNRRGSDYLKTLGLDFPYSKPKELIDHLMRIAHIPQDAIILDFFAGSGTTGEAVLDLNNEDKGKGKRKFILCTNNEGQIAEEVCYPRIEKIIKGYTKKSKNREKIKGLGGNLQYFKTDLIPVERIDNINDKQRHELTEKAGQMIAIKENTFEEVEINEWYQIFENKDKTKKTAIYFREATNKFEELINKIKNDKVALYIFSYNRIEKELFKYLPKNIVIDDVPEPILEIYKEINLTLKDK